jgi:predicted metalloprotease with PDZ domain
VNLHIRIAQSLSSVVLFLSFCGAHAQTPIRLDVDASTLARHYVHAHLQVPIAGGPVALSVPKWIPGAHAPTGKVSALGGIVFRANGVVLPWRRDLLDAFVFHMDAPAGARSIEADFDFLPPVSQLSTRVFNFHWNSVTMYVTGKPDRDIPVVASLKLPAGWHFGTALPVEKQSGDTVQFKTASLETMVDSPVLVGQYMKEVPLTPGGAREHFLDVATESEAELPTDSVLIGHFTTLIGQAQRLYGSQHYRNYHFLVNASDFLQGGGIEHHESSDNHLNGNFFVDAQQQLAAGYLLPHEYSHSWCGKFRRPADLATTDYQQPMKTDLLWVYEGLDDYNADLLVTRSGFWTPDQTREYWAMEAAQLDRESGRTWRSLQDTADAVPDSMVSGFSGAWPSFSRGADYYPEGVLIWLEANEIIREKTAGKKSMDDFSKIFFKGEDGVPVVKTYDEAEVFNTLNSVAPYDWATFFHERLRSLAPHAPMAGLERAGWRLVYSSQPNIYMDAAASRRHSIDALYSIGISATAGGNITDSLRDGPAFAAGLTPGMVITQVNGGKWSPAALQAAVAASAATPVVLTATYGGVSKSFSIAYAGGPRFPHLERIRDRPDTLESLFTPLR